MDVLGFDIGGVILPSQERGADTSFFGPNYLATPLTGGIVEAIVELREQRFGRHIAIVSKAGDKTARRSLEVLAHHNFFARTGIRSESVQFCRERAGKVPIARELGLTHYVDDRLEILGLLAGTVDYRFLFGGKPPEIKRYSAHLPFVRQVAGPSELVQAVLAA